MRLPDGADVVHEHDDAGRLVAVDGLAGRRVLERDADGRVVAAHGPEGTERWTYADGVLVQHQDARGAVTRLLRDALGRVVASGDRQYEHDEAGQLVRVRVGGVETTYAYDAGGRLVRETSPAGETRYEYDLAAQLVATWSPDGVRTDFAYDAAGRRTRQGQRTFAWDAYRRMAGVDGARLRDDALGELARVDDAELLWDTADPLSPLLWLDGAPPAGTGAGAAGPGDVWAGPDGELEVGGLTWLRARAYDPSTRSLLSPDPLPPVPGAPWAGNPYSYAGNDPVGARDPLGLRPVSDEQLRAYRDQAGRNVFERGWDWVGDNKDAVIAGVLIVGGVAIMATGVGGPVGAAIVGGALLGGGISTGVQKATKGSVDYGQVAIDAVIGGASGGMGAGAGVLLSGTSRVAALSPVKQRLAIAATEGVVEGAASGAATRGLTGGNALDPRALANDVLLGGSAGGVGGRLGGSEPSVRPPRFVASRQGLIDTESKALHEQIRIVVEALRSSGTPPPGVRQGGSPGQPGLWRNREGRLPEQPSGYYTESDVWPGPGPRGTERLVLGSGGEVWYTPDHYWNFRPWRSE